MKSANTTLSSFGMKNKFYITTAIVYVNASPHIGFAKEVIMADTIARYNRLLGKEVYFLTGTDEHGAKIVRSAEKANMQVDKFVDENTEKVKELIKIFNISNDGFVRTSDKEKHFPAAIKMWKKLVEAGDIYKKSYKGLYCVGHEAFITERDLELGKCKDHGQVPEEIEEENYFFKLSRYANDIKRAIESDEMEVVPKSRKNEILAFMNEGVHDISFSRPSKDISWGVPVPNDPEQTMYVWCDALTNYISYLGYGRKDDALLKKFWPADVQLIGKDILRFHAAIWPGMLMSAGLPLPKKILVHGFITSGGQKMSKTIGNVIDPFDMSARYGAEVVRYYILRETSAFGDGDFTEEKLKETYNANLANGLGNFVSRTTKMITSYFDGVITKSEDTMLGAVPIKKHFHFKLKEKEDKEQNFEQFGVDYVVEQSILPEYKKAMDEHDLQRAADIIWQLIGELDGYIQDYEPFKLIKEDPEKTRAILWNLAYGMFYVAWMLKPFMPDTADKMFEILGVSSDVDINSLREFKIHPHEGLFPRFD